MGHSRLLSKLANLLRKTCIKIGWSDTRRAPRGTGQTGAGGCHFGSPVSIVATRRSEGAARGGLSDGECEGGAGKQEWMEDNRRSREAVE